MKKTALLALMFAWVSVPAAATEDWREKCAKDSDLAKLIMKARQSGVPMSTAIKNASGNTYFESMVIAAYDKPRYSTEPIKQRTIEEFRDDIYMQCVKQALR